MNIKIELPAEHVVISRGIECAVDVSKLSVAIIQELALHGLTQKVADAASQAAKIATETNTDIGTVTGSLMAKAVEALLAGEWTRRGTGAGVDERTMVGRSLARAAFKAKVGAKSEAWKAFDTKAAADQNSYLDVILEANADMFAEPIEAKMAERKAERERKAKLGKMDIAI